MFAFVGFVVVVGAACVGGLNFYKTIKVWREDSQRYYDYVVNKK